MNASSNLFFMLLLSVTLSSCVPLNTGYAPPPQEDNGPNLFRGLAWLQVEEAKAKREEMRLRASLGDEEAAQWLRDHSATVDMMEAIYQTKADAEDAQRRAYEPPI